MSNDTDAIFLDTSIAIARTVHSPETKRRIKDRIKSHRRSVSSLVVRQEFKRRLLKEAKYLLNLLNAKGSVEKVHRHVVDVLPRQQERKRNICLETLSVVFEGAGEKERTERARRYLRQLLRAGLADFANAVDSVIWQSGCACSNYPVTEVEPYKRYEFGPEKCSRVSSKCGITDFFAEHAEEARALLAKLKTIQPERKTAELKKAEMFIENVLNDVASTCSMDPCLTVGDLVIALESAGVDFFYSMNSKESQYLCRALNQSLIVRPKNPDREDVVCLNTDSVWREF